MKSKTIRKGTVFAGIAIIVILVLVIGGALWLGSKIEKQNGPEQNYSETKTINLSKPTDPKTDTLNQKMTAYYTTT
ncbi:MAG: hypothetical protein UX61_C0014G0012 [Parcubacteria group bacterium GW2011_GWA2_46_7]|nr:MAG: hypothetical protein UX15_C0032G0003 [Parcubacteria group bacterium GW2011_GWA1_45_7]KKU10739.1 MAG: hypothetical protein UX14_C0010G0022 [Parcubacteria group bacterium GW2011_GWF1_45_5]KKU43644.1 MAG: hypothetical protein UX61_C0014G0012 [Parcubacteria group bacterium GW2011_GWA2_46_7]OHD12210.1 MAG: hypothetical protein A2Z96_03625 [Spirochaetes bacterium GWB1_48_6]